MEWYKDWGQIILLTVHAVLSPALRIKSVIIA
jgi:hypothetical protein